MHALLVRCLYCLGNVSIAGTKSLESVRPLHVREASGNTTGDAIEKGTKRNLRCRDGPVHLGDRPRDLHQARVTSPMQHVQVTFRMSRTR